MQLEEKLLKLEERARKRKARPPLYTGGRKVARLTNEKEEFDGHHDHKEEEDEDMVKYLDSSQSDDEFECVPCGGDEGTSSEDTLDENDDNDDDTQACTEIASAGAGTSSVAGRI